MRSIEYNDCHMHAVGKQKNGILIALDGRRGSEGGYDNTDVLEIAQANKGIIPAQYITWDFPANIVTPIIKYHPRREHYSVSEVQSDIKKRKEARVIIIDTLNQPNWEPKDYWTIAKENSDRTFLFSHTGGFDMMYFLNIAMFQPNVWIDFSFVQHVFGWCGNNTPMPQITQMIDYALTDCRIYKKVMFGTDNMTTEDDHSTEALEKYMTYNSFQDVVVNNFLDFKEKNRL